MCSVSVRYEELAEEASAPHEPAYKEAWNVRVGYEDRG